MALRTRKGRTVAKTDDRITGQSTETSNKQVSHAFRPFPSPPCLRHMLRATRRHAHGVDGAKNQMACGWYRSSRVCNTDVSHISSGEEGPPPLLLSSPPPPPLPPFLLAPCGGATPVAADATDAAADAAAAPAPGPPASALELRFARREAWHRNMSRVIPHQIIPGEDDSGNERVAFSGCIVTKESWTR